MGPAPSLDDAISSLQERRRDRQPEGLRRLQVDGQLELARLLDGQVTRLRPLEDLVDTHGGPPPEICRVRPVGDGTPGVYTSSLYVEGRQPILLREPHDFAPVRVREGIHSGHD